MKSHRSVTVTVWVIAAFAVITQLISLYAAFGPMTSPAWVIDFGVAAKNAADAQSGAVDQQYTGMLIDLIRALWLVFSLVIIAAYLFPSATGALMGLAASDQAPLQSPLQAQPSVRSASGRLWGGVRGLMILSLLLATCAVLYYHLVVAPWDLHRGGRFWGQLQTTAHWAWEAAGWDAPHEDLGHELARVQSEPALFRRMYHAPYTAYAPYSLVNYVLVLIPALFISVVGVRQGDAALQRECETVKNAMRGLDDSCDERALKEIEVRVQLSASSLVSLVMRWGVVLMLIGVGALWEAFWGDRTLALLGEFVVIASGVCLVLTFVALIPSLAAYTRVIDEARTMRFADPRRAQGWLERIERLAPFSLFTSPRGLGKLSPLISAVLCILGAAVEGLF